MKEQFKEIASLIAEPVRATILWELLDGRAYTATELGTVTETTASNISMHLAKLLQAGLLRQEKQGRHRYYSFADEKVAYVMEALTLLMPYARPEKDKVDDNPPVIRQARTCYDHLAGKTGVAITDALIKTKLIIAADQQFSLSNKGQKWFEQFGIDIIALQKQRRTFIRPCLDWSERRYHMAGSLAAAFLNNMLQEDWFRKIQNSRAVQITAKGQKKLYELLKLEL
jgi:DNA-binding transcriptional ArsR family regulator